MSRKDEIVALIDAEMSNISPEQTLGFFADLLDALAERTRLVAQEINDRPLVEMH